MRRLALWTLLLGVHSLCAQPHIFYEHWHLQAEALSQVASPPAGAQLGAGLAHLGDLDGDGLAELALGQPGEGQAPGSLLIVSLDTAGEVRHSQRITRPASLASYYLWQGNWGQRVESLGDWDGDGVPDVAVCEPDAYLGALPYGIVWILLLQADGSLKRVIPLHGRVDGLQGVVSSGKRFGQDILPLGDVNGNGQVDLVVGAPGDPDKARGEVYLLRMAAPDRVGEAMALSEHMPQDWQEGLRQGDQWGYALASPGDLDRNGWPELMVGAPGDDGTGVDQGAVHLLWLGEKGLPLRHHILRNEHGGFDVHLDTDDRWGASLAHLPGLMGDSLVAVATGAFLDDDGSKNRGAIYVLALDAEGAVRQHHKISFTTPNFEGEASGAYRWGYSLNPAGDLDGDQRPDLLVNGHREDRGRGSAWVLRPQPWPDRLKQELSYAEGAFQVSAADSARLYAKAQTAADSARIDSLYDLSGYAPTHLVLLLDVSASMNQPRKLPILREALVNLLPFLRPEDRVSIITYSGKPHLQLAAISAEKRDLITETIETLKSQGGTKPRKALAMAYALAEEQFIPEGNNRIIFATDGGFNPDDLDRPLRKDASPRIPMSVFYFGNMADFTIAEMQALARRGHGHAAHITGGSVTGALLREIKMIRRKEAAPLPPDE